MVLKFYWGQVLTRTSSIDIFCWLLLLFVIFDVVAILVAMVVMVTAMVLAMVFIEITASPFFQVQAPAVAPFKRIVTTPVAKAHGVTDNGG